MQKQNNAVNIENSKINITSARIGVYSRTDDRNNNGGTISIIDKSVISTDMGIAVSGGDCDIMIINSQKFRRKKAVYVYIDKGDTKGEYGHHR